jgi:hypothetical protein
MPEVIARVNENNRKMDFLLRVGGVSASGRWRRGRDPSGQSTSFDMTGAMFYRKPRCLFLKLTHTFGGEIQVGSNDHQFWVWERGKDKRYWWGEHQWMKGGSEADLPIRPDVLLDVLGLGELPAETSGPGGPVFWVREAGYQLIFLERDEFGQSHISKVVEIDRRPPFLVRSITYFDPDGRPVMSVDLSEYKQVEDSTVLAPWRVLMRSLENDSRLEMKFLTMRRHKDARAEANFISPMQRGVQDLGRVIRVDDWQLPTRPARAEGARTSAPASAPATPETRPSRPATRLSAPDP